MKNCMTKCQETNERNHMVGHLASHALSIAHREAEKDHNFYFNEEIYLAIGEKSPSALVTTNLIAIVTLLLS